MNWRQNIEDSLVNLIIRASKVADMAMARRFERKVLFCLAPHYSILGTSTEVISMELMVEIKCPIGEETKNTLSNPSSQVYVGQTDFRTSLNLMCKCVD